MAILVRENDPEGESAALGGTAALRRPLLRILFFHSGLADIERCVQELDMQFRITTDVVSTSEQLAERIESQSFDIVLADYTGHKPPGATPIELLFRQEDGGIPLIFLTHGMQRETMAELIVKGAADCVEMDHITHLPVAIRRALDENKLRKERDGAEKKLRHSEGRYRALVGNLTYGICWCSVNGQLLDVNLALVTMLGYKSNEEVLALNLANDILGDARKWMQLLREAGQQARLDPIEIEWKRRDGTILKARLSAREIKDEHGGVEGYEVIAEDVTKQRELEGNLRRQADEDSLTGLANYGHLVAVLDSEIKRSKRTEREFALLLLDLDRLKEINDRYGHPTGSEALCRLASVLSICSRDIDTAARFGGDEFALVLPETGLAAGNLVAQRISDTLANDVREPRISVSIGVAIYPQDGDHIETLLSSADVAMYSMKRQRRKSMAATHAL